MQEQASSSHADPHVPRRPATAAEAQMLGNPLRIRILRITLDQPLTNKEIADRLGVSPGTTLYHVRQLTRHGFLEPAPERTGRRGAREIPYRSTGKSWLLSFTHLETGEHPVGTAVVDASYAEYREAPPADRFGETRRPLRLHRADVDELAQRIWQLVDDFAAEHETEDGEAYAVFWAFHRRHDRS
jgi:DNA-binding transcriptional ArsR family regulator